MHRVSEPEQSIPRRIPLENPKLSWHFSQSTKMIRGVYLSLAPIEKQTILLPSIALSMVCPAVSRDEQNKREDVGATVPDRATRSSNRMSESYRE